MTFNSDKFELLRFKINELNLPSYHTPDKSIIKEVACVKDLGVHIDSSGTFEANITEAVKKCNNMAAWILRVFTTREEEPMMTLFKSMVIPRIEYCCQLWSPHLLKDI